MASRLESLDVATIKKDFPLLERSVHGKPIVYVDSAATSQKPRVVLDAMTRYYETINANVHRGVYHIAEQATNEMEAAREKVRAFIGARSIREIVFTKNATESLNLVAHSWGRSNLRAGDVVVLTELEHHANLVPWHMLKAERDIELRFLRLTADGQLDLDELDAIVDGARLVSFSAMSNVLGTLTPVRRIADAAHAAGAVVCVDACQYVPHLPTDVDELGVDLMAFSGHKMCGPTGIGVLWGRQELLEDLPPFLGGGEMIETVSMHSSTYAPAPHKFEAGTPPIAQAVGLGAAIDYLNSIGMDKILAHEHALTEYAVRKLNEVPDLRIIGPTTAEDRGAAISFTLGDIHPHDVGQVLDEQGIAVRVGHHCARPVCLRYGIPATTRASFYLYSTPAEIDALVDGLEHVRNFFG